MGNEAEKNYVVDIKDAKNLKDEKAIEAAEGGKVNFAEFDKKIDESFKKFINQIQEDKKKDPNLTKDDLQKEFNEWLAKHLEELDILQDNELEEKIILPTSFELVKDYTVQQLLNLEEEVKAKQIPGYGVSFEKLKNYEENKAEIHGKFFRNLGIIANKKNKEEVKNAISVAKDIIATDWKVFFNGDEVWIDDFLEALSNKKIKFSGLTLSSEPEYKLEDNMPKIKKIEFSGEWEVETKKDTVSQWTDTHIEDEQKNKYGHATAESGEQVETPEAMASDYDALIDYMEWKDNNNLIQAFQRLHINPNNIANVLAQILSDNPDVAKWSFTKDHISDEARKQLWRNPRLFVNEKKELLKILNNVDKDKLQQFINEMKVFNDIRELHDVKKYVEINKNNMPKDPFRYLSDFGWNWKVDEWSEWLRHKGRTSEQAMYDIFVSLWETTVEWWKKIIVDWEKTADLVQWVVSMIKSVWDGRYENIEADFSGWYTMENLWNYMISHPEIIVLYQQTINTLSYNPSVDISKIVSHSRREVVIDNDMETIDRISTNRDNVDTWFGKQKKDNPELAEWFDGLSDKEQENTLSNMAIRLNKWWILQTIVKVAGVWSNVWVKLTDKDLDAWTIKRNRWKDDAWIWPRISFCGALDRTTIKNENWDITDSLLERWLWIHIDVPIVNFPWSVDLNRSKVETSTIYGVNPITELYGRLWANVWWWFTIWEKPAEDFDSDFWDDGATTVIERKTWFHLSAGIEAALWWKDDYKKGIEVSSSKFWNVLQQQIFDEPDFSSKEWFSKKATEFIDKILQSTEKSDKNLKKFMENNKQEMYNCIDNVSKILDAFWVFDPNKKQEHKQILLDSIIKWIVEEVKSQNLWELNGKSKLTRLWIFWQAWVSAGIDFTKLFKGDFKWAFKWWSFGYWYWLEATISAWNMIYLSDKEKYEYMDAQLKSWESIKPLGEGVRTDSLENVRKAIMESLSENSIPNIKVASNDKWQIEISVEDDVLKKYEKNNIYELFNIYVNPDKKGNVAISEDGKTLTIWWNNLENFSVATRRYFDDFAVYLMIGWKWIDGCENNKINEETIAEYNTAKHFQSVPGFEFKSQEPIIESTENTIDTILSENGSTSLFKAIENALSKIDDEKWNDYVKFMEETCDTKDDEFIKNEDYNKAFDIVKNLLNTSKDSKLSEIKNIINGINDDNEKVYVVDRFKMVLSLVSWTDSKKWLKNLVRKRWKTYESLKWYATTDKEFPLAGKSYRDKLISSLWNGKVNRIPDSNLVWMTAFYKRWHVSASDRTLLWHQLQQAYWYSMTEIWWTDYLWSLYNIEKDDLQKTQEWFLRNLEKSEVHKNTLKNAFSEKIWNEITDEQLLQLLKWEEIEINIDNWVKKVKIEVDYVFYLLWECANESIWVKLWSMTILTETKTTTDTEETTNPEDNVLEVWVDGQTLTKTESLNQNDVSVKVDIHKIIKNIVKVVTTDPTTDWVETEVIDDWDPDTWGDDWI